MPAIIFAHPCSLVGVDLQPPPDPREQPVAESARDALAPDVCDQCGQARRFHYDTSGSILLGCRGAFRRALEASIGQQRRKVMAVCNDPYPAITVAVRAALMTACGPAMAAFVETLGHDELLTVAHECGKAALAAYTRELAK